MSEVFNSGLDLPLSAAVDPNDLQGVYDSIRAIAQHIGSIVSESSSFTVPAAASYCIVDTSAAAVTAALPSVADMLPGKPICFKPTDATYNLTVDGSGAETIDGSGTAVVTYPASLTIVSDGTQWWSI